MRSPIQHASPRWIAYFGLALLASSAAQANPTGGSVVSGAATITTTPGTVTINQATTSASINWQNFSIASGELTKFQVPTSTSATLNRVTGGNISAIYGTLQSNGQLYLINPNGIVIGATGKIDTAGFLASTLDFSADLQGNLNFSGASSASVKNAGTIHAATGDVYLIAAQVENSGTISAPKGTVGLAAGNQVLLQKAGDQHLFVQVDTSAKPQATGVVNSGSIRAAAAELKAAGGNAYALAINNTGNVAATGIKSINGQVFLTSDGGDISNSGTITAKQANGSGGTIIVNAHHAKATTQGTVLNSGTIAATGTTAGATGGTVELLGDRVGVIDHGTVNVSGNAGGGTVLMGGDEHGANAAVPDAEQTYLGPDATIEASALMLGAGGKVILWGNETTQVYGHIDAMGGVEGGNGGYVETSAASLDARVAPDVFAPKGTNGTWLLDPSDVIISDTVADSNYGAAFTLGASPVTINQGTLLAALQTGDVVIDASTGTGAAGAGTITWTQPGGTPLDISTLTNAPTLTLDAPGLISLSGVQILSTTGAGSLNLVLNASLNGAGEVTIFNGSSISLHGGNFTANGNGYTGFVDGTDTNIGVDIVGSTINAQGGDINLTGVGGYVIDSSSNYSAGSGIFIGDASAGSTVETTGAGNINITGTFAQPIASITNINGVDITGAGTTIQAGSGGITVTGILGQGFINTGSITIAGVGVDAGAALQTTGSAGYVALSSASEIDVAGTLSGSGVVVNSPLINLNGASVTTTGVVFQGVQVGLGLVDDFGNGGQVNITNSTLTGSDMIIGADPSQYAGVGNFTVGTSQVSISGSAIHLVLGANPVGTALTLNINGTAVTDGSPGVSITNASTITADDGGSFYITGTGLASATADATGVAITGSTLSYGTAGSPGTGSFVIQGNSDVGFTQIAANTTYADNSTGIAVSGSTITSYSTEGVSLEGKAYAANNVASIGVSLLANSAVTTFNGSNTIHGQVLPENFLGTSGEAKNVFGVETESSQITANGARANIRIKGDTHNTTAFDGGDTSFEVVNTGVYVEDNTTLTASGSTDLFSTPIELEGQSGTATGSSGNSQQTDSFGLWIGIGTTIGPVAITNNGLGSTLLLGEGGTASGGGSVLYSSGVLLGNANSETVTISSPGGGSIGIAGVGGLISSSAGASGQAVGVWGLYNSTVATTTGDIAILAAGGSTDGEGTVAGLEMDSATIQTSLSTAGANPIPGGGAVPPLILIYATASNLTDNGSVQFHLGSANQYAVLEDGSSKLVTGNLVMGNFYDLFAAYGKAATVAAAPTFAQFNSYITGTAAGTISSQGITFNPAGITDLSSTLNQVTNLDGALVGSGGFNFYDSVSLTVDPVGGSNNLNYGQIDTAGLGGVTITVAPDQNLTLSGVSQFTGAASGQPVIASGGQAGQITLITSGSGQFINNAGGGALSPSTQYVILANDPSQVTLGGLAPVQTLFSTTSTPVTTMNTIAYATSGTNTITLPNPESNPNPGSEGGPNPALLPVNDALWSVVPIQVLEGILDPNIIGGAGGVAADGDQESDEELEARLAHKYGRARAALLLAIIKEDRKDGSTVNTGTLDAKWAANTGLSKLLRLEEAAQLSQGLTQPPPNGSLIFDLFHQQDGPSVHSDLNQAAAGSRGNHGH